MPFGTSQRTNPAPIPQKRDHLNTVRRVLTAMTALTCVLLAYPARAAGGNEACPENSPEADDIRDSYDTHGQMSRQVRVSKGQVVLEAIVAYDDAGHAVERREVVQERHRVARTRYDGDRVIDAACFDDDKRTAHITYRYDGDNLVTKVEESESGIVRRTELRYDAGGHPIVQETWTGDGQLVSRILQDRAELRTPIQVLASLGGSYQSDTRLWDATAGLGIHRVPKWQRYGGDPLEVTLDGSFKFSRAKEVTTADQLRARVGVDYNYLFPRTTFFTFTSIERNLPANLKLDLQEGILGIKFDVVDSRSVRADVSAVPVWNFRAISSPVPSAASPATSTLVDTTTSKLRVSARARIGYVGTKASVLDTLEFLPTVYGDDPTQLAGVWDRSILRNTIAISVELNKQFTLKQEVRYTRDPSMRAQATCPDSSNPLCLGYAVSTLTSLNLNIELGK